MAVYSTKGNEILPVEVGNFIKGGYAYGGEQGIVVKVLKNKVEIKPLVSVGFVRDNTAKISNETIFITRSRIYMILPSINESGVNIVE